MNKSQRNIISGKDSVPKANHKLLGRMAFVAPNRNLQMQDVLKHPLGPLPWSLANTDTTLKKSNKAALALHIERLAESQMDNTHVALTGE